jgi:branched-chain amino acid transport system ATP-binding protein
MTGALLGGMTFAVVFPIAQDHFPSLSNIQFLLTGLAAIAVSQNPNGIGGQLSQTGERLRTMFGDRRPEADVAPSSPPVAVAEPLPTRPRGDIRPPVGEPVLEVRDVVMSYGGVEALKGVDLVVARGQLAGLIGPNGAGKTTLFNVVTGLERPTAGDVILAGRPVGGLAPHARARLGLARTFQRLEVFGSLTVRDNVRAAAEFHRAWARDGSAPVVIADNILERVGLQAVADVRADSLPTGLARLVEVGRALAAEPDVLLLDEPGSGLDQAETEDLAQLLVSLRDDGMAILLVEHDVDLVMRVCDPIHVLDFGRIIASGSPNEVQASTDVQAAYLGVAAVA